MEEREKNQSERIQLPPPWCGSICRNAMNEVCVEHCALKRDCSGFVLKPGLNLIDLPRFPIEHISEMTKEEKFTSVAIYVAKIVDHLKGVEDEPSYPPLRRPNHDSSTSCQISPNLEVEDLLPDLAAGVTSLEIGEKRPSETVGPSEVATAED